jgi:prepilin-type processing-associated H-X9-DG protein
MKSVRLAFSLVELIVMIGMIALLAGLVVPAVQIARESARKIQCKNQQRQISLALLNHEVAKGKFPPGYLGVLQKSPHTSPFEFQHEGSLAGHLLHILAYIDQGSFDAQLRGHAINPFAPHVARWWESEYGQIITSSRIALFECPTVPTSSAASRVYATDSGYLWFFDTSPSVDAAFTSYLGNGGLSWRTVETPSNQLGVFGVNTQVRMNDISDGTSNTFLIGEVRGGGRDEDQHRIPWVLNYPASSPAMSENGFWERPPNPGSSSADGVATFGSFHPGVVNMGFVDGSIRSLSATTAPNVVRAFSTISGSEIYTTGEH